MFNPLKKDRSCLLFKTSNSCFKFNWILPLTVLKTTTLTEPRLVIVVVEHSQSLSQRKMADGPLAFSHVNSQQTSLS